MPGRSGEIGASARRTERGFAASLALAANSNLRGISSRQRTAILSHSFRDLQLNFCRSTVRLDLVDVSIGTYIETQDRDQPSWGLIELAEGTGQGWSSDGLRQRKGEAPTDGRFPNFEPVSDAWLSIYTWMYIHCPGSSSSAGRRTKRTCSGVFWIGYWYLVTALQNGVHQCRGTG